MVKSFSYSTSDNEVTFIYDSGREVTIQTEPWQARVKGESQWETVMVIEDSETITPEMMQKLEEYENRSDLRFEPRSRIAEGSPLE